MEFSTNNTSGGTDYLTEYRAISNKLKKRFLRRPNVSEASDQFARLARRLETQDEPQYQAACHLSVAKCEQSIGNQQGEVEAYIAAARAAFKAEANIRNINCNSIQLHLTDAINNYCNAIRILEGMNNTVQASGLCLEVANKLRSLRRTSEAIRFYQRAADLRSVYLGLEYVQSREKVASCLIDIGDLQNALILLTDVARLTQQLAAGGTAAAAAAAATTTVYADILNRCEILRVLLVLLIEPTPQAMGATYTSVIEKYAWEGDSTKTKESDGGRNTGTKTSNPSKNGGGISCSGHWGESVNGGSPLPEETFLLMQSVVMAVQLRDTGALVQLEDCLIPHIEEEPRQLMRRLVAKHQND